MPGVGRQIVGWVGVFTLLSSLTGLWLWWPLRGRWTRGFRWRRQNAASANLHHLTGFWIAIPLAMLSFTGAWISFPQFFGRFEPMPLSKGGSPGQQAQARPLERTAATPDAALAAARAHSAGPLLSISWPNERDHVWTVEFAREGGSAQVSVDDPSGVAKPPRPPRPETRARLMRRWHDGTGMGPVWQTIIFIGGIIPALLAITGIIMWLRSRAWRRSLARRKAQRLAQQVAE